MQIYTDLELVEAKNDPDRLILTYLDRGNNEIHDIVWRKQKFDKSSKKFVDDPDKLKQVEEWCGTYLDTTLDNVDSVIGRTDTIYAYDTFDSLWEVDQRFSEEDVGSLFSTTFKSIDLLPDRIAIRFEGEDGGTYCSNMKFTQLFDGQQMVNPQKKARQFRKFEDKFGVPIEERDSLIGKEIMVEVKKMGDYTYSEVKPFPKKKK